MLDKSDKSHFAKHDMILSKNVSNNRFKNLFNISPYNIQESIQKFVQNWRYNFHNMVGGKHLLAATSDKIKQNSHD